jgi:hypothetical protein
MDSRSQEPGQQEVQGEVGLGPREFYFASGVTKQMLGRYRVSIIYEHEGETWETFTDGLYPSLEEARSVHDAILRDSIDTDDHGLIPLQQLIEIRIQEKQPVTGVDEDE